MTQKQEGCEVLFQPHLGPQSWFPDESLSSAFCILARELWLDKTAHGDILIASVAHSSTLQTPIGWEEGLSRSTCMSRILMVVCHFVAWSSDASLPLLLDTATFHMEEREVCLPDSQLSFCEGEKPSKESVASLWTRKNNCFLVPERLAGPSDTGKMIEGCRAKRMVGWGDAG